MIANNVALGKCTSINESKESPKIQKKYYHFDKNNRWFFFFNDNSILSMHLLNILIRNMYINWCYSKIRNKYFNHTAGFLNMHLL